MTKKEAKSRICEYITKSRIPYRFLNETNGPVMLNTSDTAYFSTEYPNVIGKYIETTLRFRKEHLYCQSYYCLPIATVEDECIRAARIIRVIKLLEGLHS